MVEFSFNASASSQNRPAGQDELGSLLAWIRVQGKSLADGNCKAGETVGSTVCERAVRRRVDIVRVGTGWRPRPLGPRCPEPRARRSLVPG